MITTSSRLCLNYVFAGVFQYGPGPIKHVLELKDCVKAMWYPRDRKSKNFPDSKIFHAKTFRIKCVNRDTFAFATKVRKTREFHAFLANVQMSSRMESELFDLVTF